MSGFSNAVVGGSGILKRIAIQSVNFVAGVTGWSINKDGTAEFNQLTIIVQANGAAVLIYFPAGGLGNLIGSWAAQEFTDQYGNDVPAGINVVSGGILNGVTLPFPSIVQGTITQTLLNACVISNAQLTAGTSYEQTITFDTGGGLLIAYSTTATTTVVTHTSNGTYTDTLPAGVTQINNAFAWGAGAGGDGGNTVQGGNGGGAGEFAGETVYAISGTVISVVGNGGNSSSTGQGHGGDGGDSFIDNGGVYAHGGNGNATPGTGSTNTIHHDGGTGAPNNGTSGASGGANSGNPTAKGNNGNTNGGSGATSSPAAQTNSGTGGGGGANGANGSNATAPGGGGGGAGMGTNTTGSLTKTYAPLWSGSYYGPDGGTPNAGRSNSTMYQGGETASGGSFNGNQRWAAAFNRAGIAADFAGYTMTGVSLQVQNLHSWFNSGMTFTVDEFSGLPGSAPGSYPSSAYSGTVAQASIAEGATHSYQLGAAMAARFATGSSNGIGMGEQIAGSHPYNLNYYGWFAASQTRLTFTGTKTAAGSNTSGTGADGKVSFSYVVTTSQAMVFALSPVAGTDASGNAFAVGYTGPVNAIQPGSNPAVVETWHNMTLQNGWTVGGGGIAQYKLNPDNTVSIRLANVVPGTVTSGTVLWNIPTGYFNPSWAGTQNFVVGTTVSSSVANNNTPFLAARAGGTLTVQSLPANLSNIFVNAVRYPLD